MQVNIPQNKPILIYTVYRSGSTALQDYLCKTLNYKNFHEPYHYESSMSNADEFQTYKKNNTDYVWKLMPDHVKLNNQQDIVETWENSFVIRLSRRDVVKQVASWVLSMENKFWNSKKHTQMPEIEVKPDMIKTLTDYTLVMNHKLEEVDQASVHADLVYEDLDLTGSDFKPLQKPKCYNEITNVIKDHLDSQGIKYV